MSNVPIKKSDSGIPDKLLLAKAYHDELNNHIKKLALECLSNDDDDDDGADGELVKEI